MTDKSSFLDPHPYRIVDGCDCPYCRQERKRIEDEKAPKPTKLLEIEGSFHGDHLIIFETLNDLQLYVDGETFDVDTVRATMIIDALEAWLHRKYPRPMPTSQPVAPAPSALEMRAVMERLDKTPPVEMIVIPKIDPGYRACAHGAGTFVCTQCPKETT